METINFAPSDFQNTTFISYTDCPISRAAKRHFPDNPELSADTCYISFMNINDKWYRIIAIELEDTFIGDSFGEEEYNTLLHSFENNPDTKACVVVEFRG